MRTRLSGFNLDEVNVAIAVRAHRMLRVVNLWLYEYGLISSNLASVNFYGTVLYSWQRGLYTYYWNDVLYSL